MSLLSHLDLIRRIPIFSMLTEAEAVLLSQRAHKVRYKRGENLLTQGQRSDALFIVLTGKARVVVKDLRQREVILSDLQPGECVGEMSLIDNEPHSATVRADTVCDVLVLESQAFARCLAENSSLSYGVMRGLVQRLRQADRKIESLALSGLWARGHSAHGHGRHPGHGAHGDSRSDFTTRFGQDDWGFARNGQSGHEGF